MPSIDRLAIRKILDSRGNATVEVDIVAGAALGRAGAPSGASTGALEAPSWPSGGVDGALRIFQDSLAPRLRGRDVKDQPGLDRTLRELDGTPNFARIGGNVATAVSLANAKAAAASSGKPLFRYLTGPQGPSIPLPLGNVIGGGRHAIGGTTIQEYLVVSQGPTALANVTTNARVHALGRGSPITRLPRVARGRGDEGAWVAQLQDEEALSLLADVCRGVEREAGFPVRPALDFAASEFYRGGKYRYRDRALSAPEPVEFAERLTP